MARHNQLKAAFRIIYSPGCLYLFFKRDGTVFSLYLDKGAAIKKTRDSFAVAMLSQHSDCHIFPLSSSFLTSRLFWQKRTFSG